jgi:ribosomal protein S6
VIPPFEFEKWAVIALGGIPNKAQVGDMGIDGRIYPVRTAKDQKGDQGQLDLRGNTGVWYPIQVKQRDQAGRPDIDAFETALAREAQQKAFFVSFDFSRDALQEIDRFFRLTGNIIIPLTVREILEERIAQKLA